MPQLWYYHLPNIEYSFLKGPSVTPLKWVHLKNFFHYVITLGNLTIVMQIHFYPQTESNAIDKYYKTQKMVNKGETFWKCHWQSEVKVQLATLNLAMVFLTAPLSWPLLVAIEKEQNLPAAPLVRIATNKLIQHFERKLSLWSSFILALFLTPI